MSEAKKHFDAAAASYRARSQAGPWGALRRRERKAFLQLFPAALGDVLELGCGAGFYSEAIHERNPRSLTVVDFSRPMLRGIAFGCRKIEADLDSFRLSERFDLIFCAGALEFVRDPRQVLVQAADMLKPGARLLLLLPSRDGLSLLYRMSHRRRKIPVHLFSLSRLAALADASGLRMTRRCRVFPFNYGVEMIK